MNVGTLLAATGSVVAVVEPTDTIQAVVQRISQESLGAVIVRNGRVCLDGIVTEKDVTLGLACHGHGLLNLPVSVLSMTAGANCSHHDSLTDVAKLMAERGLAHLPVVQEGRFIDIVDIWDVYFASASSIGVVLPARFTTLPCGKSE